MGSSDATVHAAVVAFAIVVLVVLDALFPEAEGNTVTPLVLLLYGLILAGAHLFLAWLGDDGLGPTRPGLAGRPTRRSPRRS